MKRTSTVRTLPIELTNLGRTSLPEGWFLHPAVARINDYLMGGCDNYAVDRELAQLLVNWAPWLRAMVAINQRHRPHAVTALACDLGITQFLDLGCGLPSRWSRGLQRHEPALTYEAARAVHTDARVVYVDNDPMVCAHARVVLDTNGFTASLQADICHIGEMFDRPEMQTLDRSRPIGVLVHDLLPWVSDEAAETAMAALRDWLPAGSAISVTHAAADLAPMMMQDVIAHYGAVGIEYRPRTLKHIKALLAPWAPLPPGIVPTAHWRVRDNRRTRSGEHSYAYAAVVTA
ncbi:SAM-dependent methyltransferase [Streptomyces sp. NPDC002787]